MHHTLVRLDNEYLSAAAGFLASPLLGSMVCWRWPRSRQKLSLLQFQVFFTAVGVDDKSGLACSLFLLGFAHPVVNQVTEGLSILLSTYLLRYLSI